MNKKTLLVVESPTKAKTISKYLGRKYSVLSSMGHIVDLPKSRLAVDIKNNFEPDLITVRGCGKILNELKKQAIKSKEVLLASDNDREGEAIAWNIKNAILKTHPKIQFKRIIFNEITQKAILEAIKAPLLIDMHKVNAQKARRVLDRIVGYNLSPLLWQKVKKGLSAGRVQSVSLKLICDREKEIDIFIPQEYWTIEALFNKGKSQFKVLLITYDNKKVNLSNKKDVDKMLNNLSKKIFIVSSINSKNRRRNPYPPFITSQLQQASSSVLNLSPDKTMRIAQSLYEGIDLKKERIGLITYMRTDSIRVSKEALVQVRSYIENIFGKDYLPKEPNQYHNKKRVQDSHEAIRPTSVYRTPEKMSSFLKPEQLKLYTLIWKRFVSSQMSNALYEQIIVDISAEKAIFRLNSSKLIFKGFLKVYGNEYEKNENNVKIPNIKIKEILKLKEFLTKQHFTEAPPRYSEASIVKKLEESEVGRPSTYAPIIATLVKRYYISRSKKQLIPTELGQLTNKLISQFFPDITNLHFTAKMEALLDKVEEEKLNWVSILRDFYTQFYPNVQTAQKEMLNMKNFLDEKTKELCEQCGEIMLKKLGRYGYFLACSGFPKCKNTKAVSLGNCPLNNCDGMIIAKKAKRRQFYGCNKYPDCEFVSWDSPSEEKCSKCKNITFYQFSKSKGRYLICKNPKCLCETKIVNEVNEKEKNNVSNRISKVLKS